MEMQDFKFRVWLKGLQEMRIANGVRKIRSKAGLIDLSYADEMYYWETSLPEGHFALMRFTGLKDKRNRDIYEFDRDKAGNVVEFLNGCWCLNGDRPLTRDFEIHDNIWEPAQQ